MSDDLAVELLAELHRRLDDYERGMDLNEDQARARWREVGLPMADFEDAAGRLPNEGDTMTMLDDLRPAEGEDDDPDRERLRHTAECKVDGCQFAAAQRQGPYGGLCEKHTAEKKAERKAKQQSGGSTPVEPKPEKDGPIRVRDRKAMEELLVDLVLLDDEDLDLDAIRLEAARLLLAR